MTSKKEKAKGFAPVEDIFKSHFERKEPEVKVESINYISTFAEIARTPTVIDNMHESLFKSYQTLKYVKKMLQRGDSKETILDLLTLLNYEEL